MRLRATPQVTEAIASGDGATATAALEHESASEEKMVAGLNVTRGVEIVSKSFGQRLLDTRQETAFSFRLVQF